MASRVRLYEIVVLLSESYQQAFISIVAGCSPTRTERLLYEGFPTDGYYGYKIMVDQTDTLRFNISILFIPKGTSLYDLHIV